MFPMTQPDFGNTSLVSGPDFTSLATIPTNIKRRNGMFGGGAVGDAIVGALNGYLAGLGNPAGVTGLQQLHQMRMLQQQQAQQEQQYAQERKDRLSDAMSLIDYRAQNKPDDQFTQMIRAAGIDPSSPEGQKLYRQRVDTLASPPYFFTDPMTGRVMSIPRNQQPEILQELPPGATPIGGPTQPASGGFPGY